MRHIVTLLLFAALLVACGAPSVPSVPGTKPPAPGPEDFFTGEPTPAVLSLQRSQSPGPMLMLTSEPDPLVANVHLQRFTESGRIDFQRHYTVEVPRGAPSVDLPVEVPAEQRYKVTATVYDPALKSDEGHFILVEVGTSQEFGIMANHENRIPVPVGDFDYTITTPAEIYSGGDLRQMDIAVPPEHGVSEVVRYYGLNPWTANGTRAFWIANAGHAGTGIPNTGWRDGGFAPTVTEPTTLYYQFKACWQFQTVDGPAWTCAYIPDVEAGEPLFTVPLLPEPAAE